MKKILILFISIVLSFQVFAQTNISTEVFNIVKTINSVALGNKVEIDNTLLKKHIQNIPGAKELNQLIKSFGNNGKWINDGITIQDELKPFINVNGETITYSSKMKADLENASTEISVKVILTKIKEGKPLDITFYIDYSVFDNEDKQLISFKMIE